MFENQPKGLYALALANTGERFGYYTMLAVFVLYLQANFGMDADGSGEVYSNFLAAVYFLPLVGGILADKFGFGRMVVYGVVIMFLGYLLLTLPLGSDATGLWAMYGALALVSFGTGLFKGNLQVMVGNLYDDPQYESSRDSGFSLFYMAINIGAMFAPSMAVAVRDYGVAQLGMPLGAAYHLAFGVACFSLIISMLIYFGFHKTFAHTEGDKAKAKDVAKANEQSKAAEPELTPQETKARVIALCLVFAVVLFFWMSFHQNGLTLTLFANEYTAKSATGIQGMMFNVWNLVACIFIVYALFSLFQSKTNRGKGISAAVILVAVVGLVASYFHQKGEVSVDAELFQQFNPCFVVALTPVSISLFGWLAAKGKEPSAPRKIGYGMVIAAIGFTIMLVGSLSLLSPTEQQAAIKAGNASFVSPYWLISTYLVLTFAELLLSPMGISFVSKVAPPKLKGMMMGGWFVATAIGNKLTKVGSAFWGDMPLPYVWAIFLVACLLSALFIFSIMKRLEKVCKEN